MIRKRISVIDDRTIYQIVVRQLLPYSRIANPHAKADFSIVEQRLNGNDFTFVEAYGKRMPQGFVTGSCKNRQLFIDMLAMDERQQGRGLGSALMDAAERYGIARGCTAAFLFVDEANPRAQMFYLRKGYDFSAYDLTTHCYRMSKTLR